MFKFYLSKLLSFANNGFVKLAAIFISFIAPIQSIIFLCVTLAFVDFFDKIHVVYKLEGRTAIKSKKIEDTIYKVVFYSLAIVTSHLLDVIFIKDVGVDLFRLLFNDTTADILVKLKVAAGVAFIIIFRELKSIDESWEQRFVWSFIDIAKDQVSAIFKFRNHDTETTEDKGDK